jgi:hypothetical protein
LCGRKEETINKLNLQENENGGTEESTITTTGGWMRANRVGENEDENEEGRHTAKIQGKRAARRRRGRRREEGGGDLV